MSATGKGGGARRQTINKLAACPPLVLRQLTTRVFVRCGCVGGDLCRSRVGMIDGCAVGGASACGAGGTLCWIGGEIQFGDFSQIRYR